MKLRGIFGSTILLVLATSSPALANQPPGPQVFLSEVLILPVMIVFSIIGGAYAVLKRNQKKRSWASRTAIIAAIVAILISGAHEGLGVLVAVIFGATALGRGLSMIKWGLQARSSEKRKHPVDAAGWRLIFAGAVLLPVTIFLTGLAIAFVGYWPMIGQKNRESGLKDFVTYKLAYAKWEQNSTGKAFFRPTVEDAEGRYFKGFSPSNSNVQMEYSNDGEHFTVHMSPSHDFPIFPYNYFTSQPTYRADETGQIRMVRVHSTDEKCPINAPVVMEVSEHDIRTKLREIEGRKRSKRPKFR
jgi:hypothetical protein